MAEAIALLGVVAAGIQCTQVGLQLLLLGSSLRSKLQDAPDKVKGWLGQIEQLITLTELVRKADADISLSSLPPLQPASSSSSNSTVTWIEGALRECTRQCNILQDILKDMLQDVDDGKGQRIWKKILTVKRETTISSALEEIERHKSMLNIWLGHKNSRQLDSLHQVVGGIQEGVEKVAHNTLHNEQSLRSEFQNLSTEVNATSAITVSGFESLKIISASNLQSIGQQIQKHHCEFQSESSEIKSQLSDLVSIS